eukprot:scaffold1289_cov188-Alexandrium_tamarense.AAC.3
MDRVLGYGRMLFSEEDHEENRTYWPMMTVPSSTSRAKIVMMAPLRRSDYDMVDVLCIMKGEEARRGDDDESEMRIWGERVD